ncbi:uncharacterized protein LOC134240509 [Saccostrea cucullata]|uniref:uncharacterized protein LOC134240509 n=1 Tax=Saccostrea cuccullata TaxID=36930 RepID=UPI002ED259C8
MVTGKDATEGTDSRVSRGRMDPQGALPRPQKVFIWEDKPRLLRDILSTSRLPFVAKHHEGDLVKYIKTWKRPSDITEDQIVHFVDTKTHQMVVCKKMVWDRKSSEYVTANKRMEIRSSVKGWFEVLPEDGRPVEYFDSIQAIANVKPRRFLVRTSVVGYQLSVDAGVGSWVPLEISPGQVLTTGIVYMDQKKSKSNVKNFFKKIIKPAKYSQKDQELKYLQCFDSNAQEVMIPLIMTGVFSPVGDLTNNDFDSVYELQDLVASFSLPVRAQLIHADPGACSLPSGLVMIEGVREEVTILAGVYPVSEDSELAEIPVNAKIYFRKDVSKGHASKRKTDHIAMNTEERIYENSAPLEMEVELPVRIKTSKKSKGPGILDKLSLRSKAKKERASLKQLQEEGVFSSRLTKSDFNLESCTQDEEEVSEDDLQRKTTESQKPDYTDENDPVYRPSQFSQEDATYQSRNLPPIPKSPEEREPLYEELPVAPRPPVDDITHGHKTHTQDDDYMSPAQVRRNKERSAMYSKPPIAPRNSTKSKDPIYRSHKEDPLDFDKLFPFTEDGRVTQVIRQDTEFEDGRSLARDFEIPQYHTTINPGTTVSSTYRDRRMRADEHKMDSDPFNSLTRMRSRSHKNLLLDANATVRSHNMRHVNNVMSVFNCDEINSSLQQRDPVLPHDSVPLREFNHRLSLFEPGQYDRRSLYATSEPGSRRYQRSMSSTGINEMMSRPEESVLSGDYGYHGDSEYSYAEYGEDFDDGWRPPLDLSNLSVQEVSRSLRYIGMKDRVVKRLSNEQIDGQLLCSLDKNLLREGFPELNALDVKKIIDFINGWRPKK